jgi:hypothetical protein
MKKLIVFAFLLGLLMFASDSESLGGRGRGGGGGGRAGGGRVVQTYGGGGGATARTSTPIVGAGGGSGQVNRGAASYTTKGGATVDYRGATVGGTTGGGVSGARHVGGVQVTGPGGNSATHVGRSGAAVGPGGNAVAGKSGATVGSGPGGAFATKYKSGVAIGPQGAVGGSTRVGAVSGPYGAVAGRTTVVAGRGTYYRPATAIRTQGVYVRQGVAAYPCFRANWYAQYPGAWFAAGWTANTVWRAATWPTFGAYGYPVEPVYYDYGENVVYQDDGVYFNGDKAYSVEQYAQQATTLADDGRAAKVAKDEEWTPLGVFAMVQGEETTSNHIFQLSINKQGVIRGNYYDAVTDSTAQVYGSADKQTMRAAWTVGDRKAPVYEVGLANLTKDATTMLVHYSPERSQQFSLVRVEAPEEEKK